MRPFWPALTLALLLCACNAPLPLDDPDADSGEVTTSRTFTFEPLSLAQLGVSAQNLGGLTVDLSVRRANYTRPGTTQYVGGQKKAYAKFSFPSGVTLKGTYTLKLVEAQENMGEHVELSSKTGTTTLKSVGKPLGRGTKGAPEPDGPACATLEFSFASVGSAWGSPSMDAPLTVCEGDADKAVAHDALTRATKNLLYMSESDRPWTWFQESGGPTFTLLDATGVAAFVGEPGQAAREVDAATFWNRLTTPSDPGDPKSVALARRYKTLYSVLRANYRSFRGYRVGVGPEIHIYILGVNSWGVSGIWTVSVET